MIVVDTNLLIYAINEDSPMHAQVSKWLDTQLSSGRAVQLPWIVIIAFLRIATNPRVFPNPLTVEQAIKYVDDWLSLPNVSATGAREAHWPILQRLLSRAGTAGNLTNDAHLAAIAIERGALICSADNDFKRFEGVQHFNPLDEDSVHEPLLEYG